MQYCGAVDLTPEKSIRKIMITSVMQQSYPHGNGFLADATDPFF